MMPRPTTSPPGGAHALGRRGAAGGAGSWWSDSGGWADRADAIREEDHNRSARVGLIASPDLASCPESSPGAHPPALTEGLLVALDPEFPIVLDLGNQDSADGAVATGAGDVAGLQQDDSIYLSLERESGLGRKGGARGGQRQENGADRCSGFHVSLLGLPLDGGRDEGNVTELVARSTPQPIEQAENRVFPVDPIHIGVDAFVLFGESVLDSRLHLGVEVFGGNGPAIPLHESRISPLDLVDSSGEVPEVAAEGGEVGLESREARVGANPLFVLPEIGSTRLGFGGEASLGPAPFFPEPLYCCADWLSEFHAPEASRP